MGFGLTGEELGFWRAIVFSAALALAIWVIYPEVRRIWLWVRNRSQRQRERFSFISLRDAYDKLPKVDIDGEHKVSPLPDGTNIVKRKDGRLELALPVRLSGRLGIAHAKAVGSVSFEEPPPARLTRDRREEKP